MSMKIFIRFQLHANILFPHCFSFCGTLTKSLVFVTKDIPRQIRVSLGSAVVLGLLTGKLDAKPTTAYLMTYNSGKCNANCSFCPQARSSQSKDELLSRVSWPSFSSKRVFNRIESASVNNNIKRVCMQALNYPNVFVHLAALVETIKRKADVPISVSCQPRNRQDIELLAGAGAERIGIALDTATEKLFTAIKGAGVGGPYNWHDQLKRLDEALDVFGKGNVSTHLIVGLGETEEELVNWIQKCLDMGVLTALFAFTPVRGTALENKAQPTITSYRRIQLARYLMINNRKRNDEFIFNTDNEIISDFGLEKNALMKIIETGKPFLTSGCPDCNRPFYNEKPSGPIYNYHRSLNPSEISLIKQQLN
jgi:biotin synthase-related radical SAM superfamily protein